MPKETACPQGRRPLQKAKPLRYKHASSHWTTPGVRPWRRNHSDWFLFLPSRTWRRRPRPVRRANWSPRLRTLRRVRYPGPISFPSFNSPEAEGEWTSLFAPSLPSLPFPLLTPLSLPPPPIRPDTPLPQRENGYYLYPPVLPSTSPHFSLMPREALTPRSCSPLRDQGAAPDRPAPVTRATTGDLRTRSTPDAALRPVLFSFFFFLF